jgi:hypothetical protein
MRPGLHFSPPDEALTASGTAFSSPKATFWQIDIITGVIHSNFFLIFSFHEEEAVF